FNKLFNDRTRKGLLGDRPDAGALQQLARARTASDQFFGCIQSWAREQGPGRPSDAVRVRTPPIVSDCLSEELKVLASRILAAGAKLSDEQKIEFVAVADRLCALAGTLQEWLAQKLEGQVYWVETALGRTPRVALASAPVEVGPALQRTLYDQVPSVILTSATLSIGGDDGFRYVQNRLGLGAARQRLLGSPFDFRTQAELHLFRSLPDPSAQPAEF